MEFGRVITAMVTPFDTEGNVDEQRTEALVNHLINNGSDGLIISGTTGESPTLTTTEKINLYKSVLKFSNGRVPIIAGTGSNNTRESIELTIEAERLGVDGIMLVTPYYNKPCQRGLYEHFKQIAQSTNLPVMLYNIPGRSAVHLEADTVIELSKIDNIVSLKDATGDLTDMAKIISSTPDHFKVYSGDDQLTLPTLAIGGYGVVSVSAHIIGSQMQEMIKAYVQGDNEQAATLHQQLIPVMNAMFAQPSPAPVKAALNMHGVTVGDVRLPLVYLTDEELKSLQQILQLQLQFVN